MAYAAPDRIVTPEAVVLEFETAGIGSRLPAALIDMSIQLVLLIGVIVLVGAVDLVTASFGGFALAVFFLLYAGVIFGYPIGFETLWRGRTPGKAALGIRVVTAEGAPVRFRHASIRGVVGLVDFHLSSGTVAVLFILFSRRNQRLGDLLAGTIVLRERSGAGRPSAVSFTAPPGLESFVAALDTTALGHQEYGAVRSLLLRAPTIPFDVRDQLARQLADIVLVRLRVAVPPGLPAETFLVCVAAAYQARSSGSLLQPLPQYQSVWTDLSWPGSRT